jgi:hypothetical protein
MVAAEGWLHGCEWSLTKGHRNENTEGLLVLTIVTAKFTTPVARTIYGWLLTGMDYSLLTDI